MKTLPAKKCSRPTGELCSTNGGHRTVIFTMFESRTPFSTTIRYRRAHLSQQLATVVVRSFISQAHARKLHQRSYIHMAETNPTFPRGRQTAKIGLWEHSGLSSRGNWRLKTPVNIGGKRLEIPLQLSPRSYSEIVAHGFKKPPANLKDKAL